MPPSHVARSSQRSRPLHAVADRRARLEQRAGARGDVGQRGAPRRRHAAARRDRSRARRRAARSTPARTDAPFAQSISRSCQKLVSCSAVQTASDAASSSASIVAGDAQHQAADRVRRSPAVVEHVVPRRVARDGHVLPERARADRGAAGPAGGTPRSCGAARGRPRRAARRAATGAERGGVQAGVPGVEIGEAIGGRPRRLRPPCRRPGARTRRRRRRAAACAPAAAARRRESSRSASARAARSRRRRPRARGSPLDFRRPRAVVRRAAPSRRADRTGG